MVLSPDDVPPLEIVNGEGQSNILLTCEHAGQLIPSRLGDLGLPAQEMARHIAYDIGAAALARLLARKLDACLLIQPYSRLVIDCNRPFDSPTLVPPVSDGTVIEANQTITDQERLARFDEIHQPFHRAVQQEIQARLRRGLPVFLVSVHSFTRLMRATGERRSLSLGLLFNRDRRLADALLGEITHHWPDIKLACNEPYAITDAGDYTIPVHGEGNAIAHILIEVINDEIADIEGQERWSAILAPALEQACSSLLSKCKD